ncbi:MAG: D-glycerate dehydrogenase [Desulfobacterales bacterium]|nr:D-glycerate dehydrogenase [Desulfobacterales bacterium]
MDQKQWETHNPSGNKRVIVTKQLPGTLWLKRLIQAGCRVEICPSTDVLSIGDIKTAMGQQCDAVLGQLTEDWGDELFAALKAAGGTAYSNVAVGFNNVDVDAATKYGLPVGNTPGVLTETTAQMAVTLTFAAARRTGEAERFLRAGKYKGWLMTLFLGELLWRKTVGVIGAGRIGATYARMMVEGHKMNLIYHDIYPNKDLEDYIASYGEFLKSRGEEPVSCKRVEKIEDLLQEADCVSVHTVLDESTHHLINAERLSLMKENAVLVNTSRGPVIDEAALVAHCRKHPNFRAGLDVFENEPELKPGLTELDNVVIVPHIASATRWTREGMATLAASNVVGILMGYPVWNKPDILSFLEENAPKAAPSIVNAEALELRIFKD